MDLFIEIKNLLMEEKMKKLMRSFSKLTLFVLSVTLILFYNFRGCQQVESEKEMKPWVGKWTFVEIADSAGVRLSRGDWIRTSDLLTPSYFNWSFRQMYHY